MDDLEDLGDLGIDAPERPLPRRPRRQASTPPAERSQQPKKAIAGPTWVDQVHAWTPPTEEPPKVKVTYAIDGLLQLGKAGLLVAAGGTGKTTLLLHLLVCIATGRKFFGMVVKYGTGVLLSSDDSQDDLNGALAEVMKACALTPAETQLVREKTRVHSLQGLTGIKTFAVNVHGGPQATMLPELIAEALSGIDDLVLVAIDTLRQFSGGASNDEVLAGIALAGATTVAGATGATVLLTHHTGQQSYREGITDQYCGAGSSALADNARFVLLLQKTTWGEIESQVKRSGQEAGEPMVLRSTRGSLLVRPPPPIFLCRDGFSFSQVAGATLTRDQILDERDRAVLRAVRSGAQSKNAIAAAVGGKKAGVLDRIDDLEARGHLRNGSPNGSLSRPLFVLTTEGARFLDDQQ